MEKKLKIVLEAIENTKGMDSLVYEFSALNPFIDYVVITSADNLRQVFAIASNIRDELKKHDIDIHHFEGERNSRWILIDLTDIIVHAFLDEERDLYKLERLYADLPLKYGNDKV